VWDSSSERIGYTHFTDADASQIDRIYGTEDILARKQGAETIAKAFTDHLAVIVRVTYNVPSTTRKHWAWRMDPVLIGDIDFRGQLTLLWRRRRAKRFYSNSLEWWVRYVKRIKRTSQSEDADRRDRNELENFYIDVMYQAIRDPTPYQHKARLLHEKKAKIILHNIHKRVILMDTVEKDRVQGEEITIHQYIKWRKRRMARTVSYVTDEQGDLQMDKAEILRIFTDHLVQHYGVRTVNVECMHHLLHGGLSVVPFAVNLALDAPIEMEEVWVAIRKGKDNKSPGNDGISNEFFKHTWNVAKQDMVEVINHMYMEG
jgi:hypothetical protein